MSRILVFFRGAPPEKPIEGPLYGADGKVAVHRMTPGALLERAGLVGYLSQGANFLTEEGEDRRHFDDSAMFVYCVSKEELARRSVKEIADDIDLHNLGHGNTLAYVPSEECEGTQLAARADDLVRELRRLSKSSGIMVREHIYCFWDYFLHRMPRQRRGVPVVS